MENQQFKEQQQDRIDEGKDLKREDELKDLSQVPKKDLPSGSIFSKVSQTLSNAASAISDKLGSKDVTLEGHEDLDKDVRKQVKKINKEILTQSHREGQEAEKPSEWANELPRHAKSNEQSSDLATKAEKVVSSDSSKQGTSVLGSIQQGIHDVTGKISQGVESLKQRLSGGEKPEEREDDGTKQFKKVKEEDSINQTVNELKQEQRLEELGQEKLQSNNPFQTLSSGNKDDTESRTLGEKIKGGLNDASHTISGKVGEVSQKVKSVLPHSAAPVDKENAQQAS